MLWWQTLLLAFAALVVFWIGCGVLLFLFLRSDPTSPEHTREQNWFFAVMPCLILGPVFLYVYLRNRGR